MSHNLIAFLRARLDEDEARAKLMLRQLDQYRTGIFGRGGAERWPWVEFGFRELGVDPARVLRGIEAKRNILARYEDCLIRMEDPDYSAAEARDQAREYEDFVLPNLAAEYGDHPDYKPE